jgi:bacterioferritin-associated ferredoxin
MERRRHDARTETQSQDVEAKKLMIICICRGKSDRDINRAIENGATTLRDLQRCGIGDQCGSCHNSLKSMLARAAAANVSDAAPCPVCAAAGPTTLTAAV